MLHTNSLALPVRCAVIGDENLVMVSYRSNYKETMAAASAHVIFSQNLEGSAPVNDRLIDDDAEKIISIAYLNGAQNPEESSRQLETYGWQAADYHEMISFVDTYKSLGLRVPVIALGSKFSTGYYLVISHENDAVEIGFRSLSNISPKFAQLVIKNEAIYPII